MLVAASLDRPDKKGGYQPDTHPQTRGHSLLSISDIGRDGLGKIERHFFRYIFAFTGEGWNS